MYGWEKTTIKEVERNMQESQNPSFSSAILDHVHRSMYVSETKAAEDLTFYRSKTMAKKHNSGDIKCSFESNKTTDYNYTLNPVFSIDHKVADTEVKTRRSLPEFQRERRRESEYARFFSLNSRSSDSSLGGFSSSSTESMNGVARTGASSLTASPRPKPARASVSAEAEKKGRTLFEKQRKIQDCQNSSAEYAILNDDGSIKSKSKPLKLDNDMKKAKHSVSPGVWLANFISSLFTATANPKRTKTTESTNKSGRESTCSSPSSFWRSCLSKRSPATMEKLRNGVERTVQIHPVSSIVDEYGGLCGHNSIYKENEKLCRPHSTSISVPSATNTGGRQPQSIKTDETEDFKCRVAEKSRHVEEPSSDFLIHYHRIQRELLEFS